ncbi:MAG: 4Fe-4S binding protein [Candidatus Helarchaeota archaeon]
MENEHLIPVLKNKAKCKKCMSCVNACPVGAISYEEDDFQVNLDLCFEHVDNTRDKECFVCMMACPTSALVLEEYIPTQTS